MTKTTHTLHRKGNSLKEDYVVPIMSAKGVNEKYSSSKLAESMRTMQKAGAVNLGDMKNGNMFCADIEQIIHLIDDRSIIHGVFTNKEDLTKALCALKDKNLGMSVVVSGLFEEVFDAAKKAGLTPHSVNVSLGISGRKELLPKEECLRISTMCGHGMISPFLIEKLVRDVKEGLIKVDEAANKLAECCLCGVFNPVRASRPIEKLVDTRSGSILS